MTKQEEFHAKYLQFKTDHAAYQKEIQHKWIKFAAMRGLPFVIAGFAFGGSDSFIVNIIALLVAFAGFGVLAYAGYQWMEVDPKKFKKGFEWEETLNTYLKELGVNTDTMEPKCTYLYLSVMDSGLFRHDFIHGGKADVNGVSTVIEVVEIGGLLRVFTDKQELVPTP